MMMDQNDRQGHVGDSCARNPYHPADKPHPEFGVGAGAYHGEASRRALIKYRDAAEPQLSDLVGGVYTRNQAAKWKSEDEERACLLSDYFDGDIWAQAQAYADAHVHPSNPESFKQAVATSEYGRIERAIGVKNPKVTKCPVGYAKGWNTFSQDLKARGVEGKIWQGQKEVGETESNERKTRR